MELLLNLLWLTLALPAVWVWQHEPARARRWSGSGRLRASLLLICVLVLLFPVVSATDDLHPMRAEMEESSPFKRVAKQSGSNFSVPGLTTPGSFFARSVSDSRICLSNQVCVLASLDSFIIPESVACTRRDSRAPPSPIPG